MLLALVPVRLRVHRAAVACIAWLSGVAVVLAVSGPPIRLNTRLTIPMNDRVDGAAVGDFDQDGIPDIAVVHRYLGNGVVLFRGLGAGRFVQSASITTTSQPSEIVAADLNHDGRVDLVMTGSGAALTVLVANGPGSFLAPAYYGTTQRSDDLVVADLNGDTHPDVAITHAFTGTIDIFAGGGVFGDFGLPSTIPIPATSSSGIVAGDFNGDDGTDLAIGVASGIVLLPGHGSGGFGTAVTSSLGSGTSDLATDDFDADGVADLATMDRVAGAALVLHGTGDGHFTLARTIPVASQVDALTTGDLNLDGRPDLIVGGSDQPVFVFLGNGPGQFGAGVPYLTGALPDTLIVADLDQDGRRDLLTGNTLGNDLSLLRGDGLGRLAAETSIPFTWETPDIGAADFDGDGMTDLAVLQSDGPAIFECTPPVGPIDCGPRMTVEVLPGTGQGQFGAALSSPTRCAPSALAIGDFNGDGRLDVATTNRGARDAFGICFPPSISVLAGDGHGHFTTFADLQVPDLPDDVVAGDFNEDGRVDFAVAYGDAGLVYVYRTAPGGSLVLMSGFFVPSQPRFLAAGDLNGDGHLDLAMSLQSYGYVAVLHGDGTGAVPFAEMCPPGGSAGAPGPLSIGDFDGDGKADISVIGTNSVRVMHSDSGGHFCVVPSDVIAVTAGARGLGARDLNGDGIGDLLVTDGSSRLSAVAGTQPLSGAKPDTYGANWASAVATADFDGDGLPDVAVASPGGRVVSVVRNLTSVATFLTLTLNISPADGPPSGGAGAIVSWTGVVGATHYDVLRGDLEALRSGHGDFGVAVEACMADDLASTLVAESELPAEGDGWWYLARPLFPAGPGSYDGEGAGQVGSRDAEIAASALACP
ncbi:MAG TPA: VCBS repeat-containing protein [Candidatus Polarisedimenticolia bacterium]|jgi:hypothetical protein|nr:VCBS repeat-containing protein [Candidatus Polarisedimenticolia bacterium]